MERVIRKLTTENGMDITDVSSFETEDYVGIWDEIDDKYVLLRKSGLKYETVISKGEKYVFSRK